MPGLPIPAPLHLESRSGNTGSPSDVLTDDSIWLLIRPIRDQSPFFEQDPPASETLKAAKCPLST
jgi:hypothetical protein